MSYEQRRTDFERSDRDLQDRLNDHRELLEKLAEQDIPFADTAQRALRIADGEVEP